MTPFSCTWNADRDGRGIGVRHQWTCELVCGHRVWVAENPSLAACWPRAQASQVLPQTVAPVSSMWWP